MKAQTGFWEARGTGQAVWGPLENTKAMAQNPLTHTTAGQGLQRGDILGGGAVEGIWRLVGAWGQQRSAEVTVTPGVPPDSDDPPRALRVCQAHNERWNMQGRIHSQWRSGQEGHLHRAQ